MTGGHRGRRPIDQARWQPWIDHVCSAVGVDPARVDVRDLHEVTGEVAARYARPMAPVSAHLLGLAEAAGVASEEAHRLLIEAATAAGGT